MSLISRFTMNEFVNFCMMNKRQLAIFLRGQSVMGAMAVRRDVQIQLTRFSKGKPVLNASDGDPLDANKFSDTIQLRALAICSTIERWCKSVYFKDMTLTIIKKNAELATRPETVKIMVKEKWEKFVKERSY